MGACGNVCVSRHIKLDARATSREQGQGGEGSTGDVEQVSGLQHTLVSLCLHKLRKPLQVRGVDVQDLRFIAWWTNEP